MKARKIGKLVYQKYAWILPNSMRRRLDKILGWIIVREELIRQRIRIRFTPVDHYSSLSNVYHCCVQRTASTWLRNILSDPRIYRYSGLKAYDARLAGVPMENYAGRVFSNPFPPRTLVTQLFIGFDKFAEIPKLGTYKAFFVMREPRDIVVSTYYSLKFSHNPMGKVLELRKHLQRLSKEEGLIFVIRYLQVFGLFDALRSWVDGAKQDKNIIIVRYEDLIGAKQIDEFRKIFYFCDIEIPDDTLKELLEDYSFERVRGKARNVEDIKSHYRKGQAGDWMHHFNDKIDTVFREVTGDLVELLGYEDRTS